VEKSSLSSCSSCSSLYTQQRDKQFFFSFVSSFFFVTSFFFLSFGYNKVDQKTGKSKINTKRENIDKTHKKKHHVSAQQNIKIFQTKQHHHTH